MVVEDILLSAPLQSGIQRLAVQLGRPEPEVAEEVQACLEEMTATQSPRAVGAFDQLGRWASRAYTVESEPTSLDELKRLSGRHSLVFLPSHKSYLDPLVLRSVLRKAGFAPNHILGGINVNFWPVGPLARRSGVVFIRRGTRDDPVYKLALREYLGYLVSQGLNLEWYIEGGRSRTGKLRPPRLGALAYIVDAFRQGRTDDVYLVPTSIVYDQLHEVAAMAAEATGGAKQPEGLAWALRYARAQGQRLGTARVRFGQALSLRRALDGHHGDTPNPRPDSTFPSAGDLTVEKLAFEVCHRINQATPITPTALVTLALLGLGDRALTLREIQGILDPLLEYVERRKLPVAGGRVELSTSEGVRGTLQALVRHRVVTCFREGAEPVYAIGPDQHLVAAFYRNSVIHFFVNRAITELIAVWAATRPSQDPVTGSWEEALRLRDLLKFEFFFADKVSFAEELREELNILDPAWEERAGDPDAIWAILRSARLHLAHRVLRAFLEAYLVVADHLAALPAGEPLVEKAFLDECVGRGRQYRLQQRIHSPESVSKELFATALQLAASRRLVEPGGESVTERRRAFAAEIDEVVRRIGQVERLALEVLSEPD
jgi:glycerol-3-phosphate O-acyltransferase